MRQKFALIFIFFALLKGVSYSSEWPSWRGEFQNGVSTEKGLISQWSVDGENLIWKAPFRGRSTPVVMNGRVYVIGRTGEGETMQENVACFDARDGKKIWEKKFNVYLSTVPFSRAGWASLVGDLETGYVYMHGVGGLMICFDKDGNIVWQHSLAEEYGHLSGFGGRTDTAIVDEGLVILGFVNASWGEQAAPRHRYFAWDKKTGELIWVSTPGVFPQDFNIYSTPVVSVINGQRLLIGGNGDGSIYAMKVRTGQKVWGFQLSKRGINTSVVVDGNTVYAGHSEENLDEATMGRVVAIDATGTGDITKTGEKWRYDELEIGYTGFIFHEGHLYAVDNSANLYNIDATSGKLVWKQNLGTVGKGSPVWADGKIYATEVNGTFAILKPEATEAKILDKERIKTGSRHAEIYGSPAIAYGRIFFTTEEGLYCLGNKTAKMVVKKDTPAGLPGETKADPAAQPASLLVVPAEAQIKPGESVQFHVRSYDNLGRFLNETKATWTLTVLKGNVDDTGKLTIGEGSQAGTITAQIGELKASARVRSIADLPIKQDFEAMELEKSPPYWIGSTGKFFVREKDGSKVLAKPPVERGLQSTDVYFGPPTWKGYTIQADVMGTQTKQRVPDIGLINSGYSLYILGSHERLQLFSWGAELRVVKKLDFAWKPDVWYTMKLQVDIQDGKGLVRGKIWPRGDAEPSAWTLELTDPVPILQGTPGIYGNSNADLYFDNISVVKSES